MHVAPAADESFADLAAQLASDYRLTPDPWQSLVLTDWLAERRGRYASLTCGLACSRQNGKNGILEIRELFGMVGRGERILHTAHEVKTARKAFKRLQFFFGKCVGDRSARFPELNALVAELRNVNGQEAIILTNGGSVEIVARSQGSGRGFTVDVLVADEAQDMSDDDLEALMPATSAAPLRNPQWIFTGTPPGPRSNGEVFTRTRTDALGSPSRLCWHEWSLDQPDLKAVDLDDRALWFETNPALGDRLQLDVVQGERERFSDEGFARERLGWWKPAEQRGGVFGDLWPALADPSAERGASPCFGVAVAPDRTWSAVAVAWARPDGRTQVMLADYKPGTAWIAGRVKELLVAWGGTVVASTSAKGLIANAVEPSQGEQALAHTGLDDAVSAGTVRHGNEPALNTAVRAARWRPYGDSRMLDRKGSADISPLDAAALAVRGVTTEPSGGWMVSLP